MAGAWIYGGAAAAATVAILIAMEVSLSFDNAVVNAGILRRLSQAWQRAFLTVGIAFAVFGMRIVFPIAIVALATGDSMAGVTHLALQAPDQYARRVEEAAPIIGAFGGMFLLSLSLRFLSDPARRRHWIGLLERPLQRLGATPGATIVVAGLGGAAGFAGFLFLETLDASFSLDGVLGAFALTSDIVAVGLGLGILAADWLSSVRARNARRAAPLRDRDRRIGSTRHVVRRQRGSDAWRVDRPHWRSVARHPRLLGLPHARPDQRRFPLAAWPDRPVSRQATAVDAGAAARRLGLWYRPSPVPDAHGEPHCTCLSAAAPIFRRPSGPSGERSRVGIASSMTESSSAPASSTSPVR